MNMSGHKSPKLETSPKAINRSVGKQTATRSHNGILHSKEKEQTTTVYLPQVDLPSAE